MPTFQITGPDGKKYRVTGENAEGAFRALQEATGTAASEGPKLDAQQMAGIERGKALAAARARGEDVPMPSVSAAAARNPRSNQQLEDTALNRLGAFTTGGVENLPIVGAPLMAGVNRAAAGLHTLTDGTDYEQNVQQAEGYSDAVQEQFPGTAMAGSVTGNIAAMGAAGATGVGSRVLGLAQPTLLGRVGASLASNAAISGADTAVRGGDAGDITRSAVIGGALGGAIPVAGAALQKGYRAAADGIGSRVQGLYNPEQVAGTKVGKAILADRANPAERVLGASDEASASLNNQTLLNVDRGGETTRALARVASNSNPEARAAVNNLADDRFATQGERGVDFVKRIMGGNVDDLGLQDRIKNIARITNKKAYDAAEAHPNAQRVWDQDLAQLMQSPSVQRAAVKAAARSGDRVAVNGGNAVSNPFKFVNGRAVLRQQADGSTAVPSLRFWDQVKRNIDEEIGEALGSNNKTRAGDLKAINDRLLSKLDGLVPEYQKARRGAAAAFGADDAVEAGKIFARQTRNVPEMERAIGTMSPAEKKAFEVGYASEIVDKIRSTNDRASAVRMFKSPEMRAKFDLALGPKKTQELEAFVKVEDAMDKVRGALGNSTTTRQLVEMGLMAGTTGGAGIASFSSGNPKYIAGALAVAALRYGGGRAVAKVDANVMRKVADLLVSDDPQAIEAAVRQAAFSPAYLAAVEAITKTVGTLSRAGAVTAGTAAGMAGTGTEDRQTVRLDVRQARGSD